MGATPSTSLESRSRAILVRTAVAAIDARLAGGTPVEPALGGLPAELRAERASFVTLTIGGELRGCCGTIEPRRALALDVWRNAQVSAFDDPRFPPLAAREWAQVDLEIAVLSPLERVEAPGEEHLLQTLVPGQDGLVIAWRDRRATFLPKVWEHLHEPRDFLARLKAKAGWPADFWAADVQVWRYRTESLAADRREIASFIVPV
ncbi:MAG: AmmeMemoRadiSam system protein A [Steroidobacteraceae bacterium]